MSCSPFDLKDYFLDELPNPRRLEVEAHVQHCQACREELDRLRLTQTALTALGGWLAAAIFVFNRGLRRYSSASS